MRIIISHILLGILIVACSSVAKDSGTENKERNIVIKFSKSACYGKCKVYNITVRNSIMELQAKENTPLLGEFTSELTPDELDNLFKIIDSNQLMSNTKNELYDQELTDLPHTELNISVDNMYKSIRYRSQAPKSVAEIDKFFKSTIEELHRWESKK